MLPSQKEAWGKSVSLEMEGSGRFDLHRAVLITVAQSDISAGLALTSSSTK